MGGPHKSATACRTYGCKTRRAWFREPGVLKPQRATHCTEHITLPPGAMLVDPPVGRPRLPTDRIQDSNGYIQIRVGNDLLPEHRVVMMAMVGRELRKGESVHHRNGQRNDNRPENLELWVGPIRHGARASDLRCPHCGERWLAAVTPDLTLSVDEVASRIVAREWSILGQDTPAVAPQAQRGIPAPVRKLVVRVVDAGRPRRRFWLLPGQLALFPVDSFAEEAA